MVRWTPRGDQHDIEPQVASGKVGPLLQKRFRRARDPAALMRRDGFGRQREIAARLDLDEGNQATALRHDVYFADMAAHPPRDDAPAAQPQMPDARY